MREISPELVLIDPELAARERLRLAEDAAAATRTSPVSSPPATFVVAVPGPTRAPLHTRARRVARETSARLTPTLLFVSLLLNLVFAASLFAGNSQAPTLEASAPGPAPSAPRPLNASRPTQPQRHQPRVPSRVAPRPAGTKGQAERAVLHIAQQAAARRAPKLVDPATGLLANNTQAVCSRSGESYLCVVRPALHRPGEGLYVRYRPGGHHRRAGITWLGYRVSG